MANCQENPHCSKIPNVPVINLPGKWKCNSLSEHTILPSNQSIMYTICTQRKTNNPPFQAIPYLSTSLVITIQYGVFYIDQWILWHFTGFMKEETVSLCIKNLWTTIRFDLKIRISDIRFILYTAKYTPNFNTTFKKKPYYSIQWDFFWKSLFFHLDIQPL